MIILVDGGSADRTAISLARASGVVESLVVVTEAMVDAMDEFFLAVRELDRHIVLAIREEVRIDKLRKERIRQLTGRRDAFPEPALRLGMIFGGRSICAALARGKLKRWKSLKEKRLAWGIS